MFEIPGIVIILTVATIALMGGFSSKKSRMRKRDDRIFNPITTEYLTPLQVRLARENKTPLHIEVEIMGDSVKARRRRVAELNVGDDLLSGWVEQEDDDLNREYFIVFISAAKKIYAVAPEECKRDLAHRFDYIKAVKVVELDKTAPRMSLEILFD